jgi:iron complex transport system substrate-binding protein
LRPQRIVSLLASGTEILYGLGLGERVVGVSHECDFPEAVRTKPRVTRANIDASTSSKIIDEQVRESTACGAPLYSIDSALLASLRPDLIVTQSQCDVCAVDYKDVVRTVQSIDALRATKIVSLNPTTLEAVFGDIVRVGRAADCGEAAHHYIERLRNRVESVRERTGHVPPAERPRVLCVEWIDPVMVAANWMPDLIALAGGRCDLTRAGERSGHADWHAVVAFDPQVIIVMPCGFDLERSVAESAALTTRPGWDDLAAVCDRRVFAVDGNAYFNRSGPRIVDSLEILAALIHPARCDRSRLPAGSWAPLS